MAFFDVPISQAPKRNSKWRQQMWPKSRFSGRGWCVALGLRFDLEAVAKIRGACDWYNRQRRAARGGGRCLPGRATRGHLTIEQAGPR